MVNAPVHEVTEREEALTSGGRIYEYVKAANPDVSPVPAGLVLGANEHLTGATRVIPFDLSKQINTPYPASSPNLLVGFIRIVAGEAIATTAVATSQAFYVIRGKGTSTSKEHGAIAWATGDMVVIPKCPGSVNHVADSGLDCALYYANDAPLLEYLGVAPSVETFKPTAIRREAMLQQVDAICHEPGAGHRNRMGILLGNEVCDYETSAKAVSGGAGRAPQPSYKGSGTLTLTPTLWSLLNVLPPYDMQRPHRHQSIALDLCVYAPEGRRVYTEMGPELDPDTGLVKDGIKCYWETGAVFVTPPGWWHSHHNTSAEAAWVLPMQDAGLLTYQRALDIRFAPAPAEEAAAPVSQPPAAALAVEARGEEAKK